MWFRKEGRTIAVSLEAVAITVESDVLCKKKVVNESQRRSEG